MRAYIYKAKNLRAGDTSGLSGMELVVCLSLVSQIVCLSETYSALMVLDVIVS